jgi:hypothetical protein
MSDNFAPDGLFTTRRRVEYGWGEHRRSAKLALGQPRSWGGEPAKADSVWWAETAPGHWSNFEHAHFFHVETGLKTTNEHNVNAWKGRDEIRGYTEWWIKINGEQVYEGRSGTDVGYALRSMERALSELKAHDAINWGTEETAAEQLMGRRIWYERTPAVIFSVSVLDQGCVMIKPDGAETFPPPVSRKADEVDDDPYERGEYKVDILRSPIYWWRDE